MASQSGRKARDDSARPLRIARRIHGISGVAIRDLSQGLEGQRALHRSDCPEQIAACRRTRMAASSASLMSVEVGSNRLSIVSPLAGHAQGVLANCGVWIGCDVNQNRLRPCDSIATRAPP